jgi:hypothetical protein
MKILTILTIALLLIPLALATEITGTLSSDPNYNYNQEPEAEETVIDNGNSNSGNTGGSNSRTNSGGGGSITSNNNNNNNVDTSGDTSESSDTANSGRRVILQGEIRENMEISLGKDESLSFKIQDEPHQIKINSINENSVEFTLHSYTITDTIKLSEIKRYDLNQNGINDISVLLLNIVNGQAQIEIDPLNERKQDAITGAATGIFSNQNSNYVYVLSAFGAILLIMVYTGWGYKRKKINK